MSPATRSPRPDQITELTLGVASLPLPELNVRLLQYVADALHLAFTDLRPRHKHTFLTGDEAEITALMESRLKSLRDQNPKWAALVSTVVRGWESHNYDGRRLEVRPDLSIVFTHKYRDRFPLRVECKLIDHPGGKTAADYCKDGIARYEVGDYAWACREAFMLAYVRDGSDLNTRLAPKVSGLLRHPTRADLAFSDHARAFVLRPPFGSPGQIKLWHLWLTV
jgi:hypothetical protein